MSLIWFSMNLGLGFLLGLYINAQIVLPILYGLPRSLYLVFRREISWGAIIAQFVPPLVWCLALFALGYFSASHFPRLLAYVLGNPGFSLGQMISLPALLLYSVTSAGRASLREDYNRSTYARFATKREPPENDALSRAFLDVLRDENPFPPQRKE